MVHNLPGDTEPITALCWSRDGRRVFSASRSMRCSVWDATTGESVRTFKAHSTPVLYMGVDPTGTLLVTTPRIGPRGCGISTRVSARTHSGVTVEW